LVENGSGMRSAEAKMGVMAEPASKYARFEFERRFLLDGVPDEIKGDHGWRVTDRYIKKTALRLRRMESLDGAETVFKLGQKHVPSPPNFGLMTITNIYLSPKEYAVLAQLEAFELRKRRHPIEHAGNTFGVDVFAVSLEGLVLAEVGFDTQTEMEESLALPPWAIREVSGDERFTGGALAGLTADGAAELLRTIGASER
jgi:adenylate cyclase